MMPRLRHELRTFAGRDGHAFLLASLGSLGQLEAIDGPSELVDVVYASTWDEAMQLHYGREGYGTYQAIPGVTDVGYSGDDLARQLDEFPDDAELRHLNGLEV